MLETQWSTPVHSWHTSLAPEESFQNPDSQVGHLESEALSQVACAAQFSTSVHATHTLWPETWAG
jgi:hypothetical protein